MAKGVQSKFSHVDIVINCAGVFPQKNFPEMTFADWRKVLSTNLDGTFLVTAAFVPGMRSRKWGRVVNMSTCRSVLAARICLRSKRSTCGAKAHRADGSSHRDLPRPLRSR